MTRTGDPGGATVDVTGVTHLYEREGEQTVALRDVQLHVAGGESVALLGPSGSGKTTLLSLLAGLQAPTTGTIAIDGTPITLRDPGVARRLRRDTVGLLVQEPGRTLPGFATPRQLLALAGERDADETLNRYGLHGTARQRAKTLSAGEQQRVALALLMTQCPRLLLVDEPTSRLDAASKAKVIAALHEVTRGRDTTVVAVTHDASVASTFERLITLHNGRVGTDGSLQDQVSVVGEDGTVTLTPAALQLLPPGTRVRMEPVGRTVTLTPTHTHK